MASPPAIQVESSASPGRVAPNSQGPRAMKEWLKPSTTKRYLQPPSIFSYLREGFFARSKRKKMANNGSDAKMAN